MKRNYQINTICPLMIKNWSDKRFPWAGHAAPFIFTTTKTTPPYFQIKLKPGNARKHLVERHLLVHEPLSALLRPAVWFRVAGCLDWKMPVTSHHRARCGIEPVWSGYDQFADRPWGSKVCGASHNESLLHIWLTSCATLLRAVVLTLKDYDYWMFLLQRKSAWTKSCRFFKKSFSIINSPVHWKPFEGLADYLLNNQQTH